MQYWKVAIVTMNHYARNRYKRDQEALQLNTVKQYTTAVLVLKLTRQLQHLILCIELTNLSIPIKSLLKIKFGLLPQRPIQKV